MRFHDKAVNREFRFSIGRETETSRYYLSVPVSNRSVDYEEYFEISESQYIGYPGNLKELADFAEACRRRENDHLLIMNPGSDRGAG